MASILIVDDSTFIRKILKGMVAGEGISKVDEATDGYEAVQMARANNYDLIFMDIMMPKLNGIEAIKDIKPFNPDVKIVVCTSLDQEGVAKESIQAGADDYITKPFNKEEIQKVLRKHLNMK